MEGLYRDGDWAQVSDGNNSIPIPRDRYEDSGYLPPFDKLPTKDAYEAQIANRT